MPQTRSLKLLIVIASLAIGGTSHAMPPTPSVDVMRLNLNLTIRTDNNQGQKRQVSLGNKQFINLATGNELNAPVPANLVLGMTCEESPRIVIFDKSANPQVDTPVLGTVTVVDEVESKPFNFQLARLVLDPNPVDASDPMFVSDNRIDGGELQMVIRTHETGNGQNCPKNGHISTISGVLNYHATDAKKNEQLQVSPGIVIRGVANAVPPVLGQVEPAPDPVP